MKILFVTGQLASKYVRDIVSNLNVENDILVIPYPVAALLTPKMIIKYLRGKSDLPKYDMIMVPGLISGDLNIIEKEFGIPTYKGPRDAGDIPYIVDMLIEGKIKLSKERPACEIVNISQDRRFMEDYHRILNINRERTYRTGNYVKVRNVIISKYLPLTIIAEVINAPKLSKSELISKVTHYVESGAHIIDIGMVAGENNADKIPEIIRIVRSVTDLPISIDTLNVDEIEVAVENNIDMIISLDLGNIDVVHDLVKDVCCVLIPCNHLENYYPEDIDEKISAMRRMVDKAVRYNIKSYLCDLILNPIHSLSLTDSIVAFQKFSKMYPDTQLMMGVGNVTELIDVDSPGLNAILAGLASELGVSAILTTEASDKTYGTVRELSVLAKMMYVAKYRRIPPKDLGINLLLLKEKRKRKIEYEIPSKAMIVEGEGGKHEIKPDSKGYFRIWIDWSRKKIIAMHYKLGDNINPDVVIVGNKASDIYMKIIELNLVSELSHAAYLGKELTKAEIALKLGRSYIQDEDIF